VALLYKLTGGEDDDSGKSGLEQDTETVNLPGATQRNGPAGGVALTFLRAYTRFDSAATVGADDSPE